MYPDRQGRFLPRVIEKWKWDANSNMDQLITQMYGKGLSTHEVQDLVQEIYGEDISPTYVSNVTNQVLPENPL